MNRFQRLFAGIGAVGISLSSIAAIAGQYDAPHKWVDSASGKTYVYVPGQTPDAAVSGFSSEKAPTTRVLTLNNCGWGSFTKSTTSPPTNITGANWPPTSGSAVTCTKDAAPATTYTASNTSPVGTIIDDGTKLWVKGGTGPGAVTLQITASGAITTKANGCGFVRVTTSTSRPMTTFKIGATSYNLSSLPTVTSPMICRKVGNSSFTYVPAT
ncbi:MAG TPA: hypothetical protein VK211_29140 [Kamptonema sp.]|nr:hypothetical protein [Kamptonema sp.]